MQKLLTDQEEKIHISQLKQGSSKSFEILYRQYQPKLFAFCYHLTHSRTDAEEIVQQTFMKIWETRDRINPDLLFSSYLIQIAKHDIYNRTAQRMRDFTFQKYFTATTSQQSNVTQEQLNLHALQDTLHSLVQKLPFMQQKVFLLSRMNGFSNQEIADQLQLSRSTVENHIFAALKTIRRLLVKYHPYLLLLILF
ncbi:MAG: RNA polymerase sigma-70 factor [Bacteroidota bacterium]